MAGLGDLFHHVALAVLPGAVLDRVLGIFAGPEAEAVVMLAGEHDAPQPGSLDRADDLVGVEIGGVEDLLRLIAVAPFAIGERIDREVEEGVAFYLMPGELPGGWNRAKGGRRFGRGKQAAKQERNQGGKATGFHGGPPEDVVEEADCFRPRAFQSNCLAVSSQPSCGGCRRNVVWRKSGRRAVVGGGWNTEVPILRAIAAAMPLAYVAKRRPAAKGRPRRGGRLWTARVLR